MGNFDRSRVGTIFKMEVTTWLSLVLAVLTFTTPAMASEPRVVCYYTNWSVYRPGTARFNPQNINPYLCTHLIYAFGGFTKDNTLKPFDKYQDIEKGGYAKFTGLKTYNKNLKTMLAIGGWNEGSTRFSPMVASRERRKEFVRNVIKFLRQNHFDGLDLDWEYPAFRDGGKAKDRENYAKLVKELREEFERESEKTGKPRLLLTMAVPAGIEYIQKGFDVKTLNRYLDWMNLLTYDYHSAFEPAVNHHAPLYPLEEPNEYSVDNELNIDYTIKFYLENGADRDKLVLGIPTYGRSYTLFNPDAVDIGSPADGPGEQGDATREKGYLAYYEICEALKPNKSKREISSDEEDSEEESSAEEDEPWTVMYPNRNAMGPVAYKGNQWVGYDDVEIVQKKAEYVAENGLGGIMFWSIDNDDFRGTCHEKPYPLIEAAKEAYISKIGSTDNAVVSPKSSSSSNRRRPRPKVTSTTTTTTAKPSSAAKSKTNNRKNAAPATKSTTPTWNIITPEPPTTPDPGSDFKCTDEGFFQHPRDCKKYFWCLDSGPSNLGIVAHQFTCPSGLFFNKAADSCDFARNVLCKKPTTTTKAPTTKAATTEATTTTRKPVKLSTKSSALFRTTSTTTPEPEEEYEDEVEEDTVDVDAEDPRVIKELIDLIKKVGGVEQLEKQLHLSESGAGGTITTTPSSFNKNLYKKVLERTIARTKQGGNSIFENAAQNRQRGPQNAGLAPSADNDKLLRKDRPQYTTINRARASTTQEPIESEEEEEEIEEKPSRARAVDSDRASPDSRVGSTAKPLQYVNIRRARPSVSTSDTADDTASRNALFERPAPFVSVSDSPESLDIQGSRRENIPEYVTIRRQRPTTEEATTIQYPSTVREEDSQETILEKEISSPSSSTQPQYTSIVRAHSTTLPPPEEPESPEPTTVLSVQISSLLNSPEAETLEPEAPTTVVTDPPPTTARSTTPATTRRPLRRRGSTTTTTSTAAPSTTQVSSRNYSFVRRRRPLARPNEIASDSDETTELSRKIRSTTPDSREIGKTRVDTETGPARRFRSRLQTSTDDSVPAEASTIPRGQYRPRLQPDELISLTPIDIDGDVETPTFVPRQSFAPRRFRGRTSTTVAGKTEDSEVSAATLDVRRPSIVPRGRGRFAVSTTTESIEPSPSEVPVVPRRPAFTKFTPRPFTRSTAASGPADDGVEEGVDEDVTRKIPSRLPFGKVRPSTSTAQPTFQARRVAFPSRQSTTPQTLTSDIDEEEQDKNEDITLSESAIEEKEHEEGFDEETNETPKRVIIKRLRTPSSSPTEEIVSTETIPINDSGKRKFRVIRRRPTSTSTPTAEEPSETPTEATLNRNRVRKVIRKKIRPLDDEPEIVAKSIGSLNAGNKDTTTEIVSNYGEKTKTSVISITTEVPSPTTPAPERALEEVVVIENDESTSPNNENNATGEEKSTESPKTNQSSTKEQEQATDEAKSSDAKPEVSIETSQKELDLSENEDQVSVEPSIDQSLATEAVKASTETTTVSTTQGTSPSSRSRAPYRPPKRVFTSTTESASPLSSRTFSRKFNPGVYTSPSTVDRDTLKPSTRRPFSSRNFTRRPITTSSTTPEPEEEYFEEIFEEEPENELVLVPPSKLFTRRPDSIDEDFQDSEEVEEDETSEEQRPSLTSRKPYKPRVINSNTFRTSTSTTELPKRSGGSQNRTSIYNRAGPNKAVDPKAKRVQNVPAGYNRPATSPATETSIANEASETTDESTEEATTTNSFSDEIDMSTGDDDYLSMTEGPSTTVTDDDETLSTNTLQSVTATAEMELDDSTDDYLEHTEQTTYNPGTRETTLNLQTETQDDDRSTEITTESVSKTTPSPTAAPIIKTQFDKLFSVSRVVEVSSKLDKHRLNKNNESRLIEEGKIMIEKKPMIDKIGEVSRFSLIKIVEDEIPIYLTKYGHIYPVENPPDNPIRIDEGRNARALSNFADGPKENLVASESINEAYRHVTKETNKPSGEVPKHRVEHIQSDDFLSFINDDKKADKSGESTYSQWQFVPAAYENEQNKLNKAAKSFEIITPRSMLTDPSTLPLEALFKTEVPAIARRINGDSSSQPFVVYSASVPSQKEDANLVKLEVLKPEVGRSIITFAKGQEFKGASVDQSTIQYPINITVLPKTSASPTTTTKLSTTSTTENVNTSPIIELLTTPLPTTFTTEAQTATTTEIPSTTETVPEESTTVRISPLDTKRKFTFPRRPIIKPSNLTRVNPVPRVSKKINATVVSNNVKSNKTSGFNPTKSRFTANRGQNVPVDFRKKANTTKVASKPTPKTFTTETPRTTTERKLYFKPIRPNLRPAFVPRKSTTPKTAKARQPFLRRTKATAPPETPDTEPVTESTNETTTNKYTRRGISKFKSRKELAGQKEVKKNEIENGTRRPSLSAGAVRSDRPRNFVRRRLGGANATSTTSSPSSQASPSSQSSPPSQSPSSPASPSSPSTVAPTSRRPFRIASRRRPSASSTSTTQASTAGLASEESVQDIGDTDAIEDPTLVPKSVPKTTVKIQRRPLVSLKEEVRDQNPSATNEEERKRQSKKYSASIKQNQLDELKKSKSQEDTTLGTTVVEDNSAETAVAIAAHQLLSAPIPKLPNYEEDPQPAKKSTHSQTVSDYSYTPQYTEFTDSKTIYSEEFSTPNYESSSLRNKDFISTTGAYEDPTTSYARTTYNPPKTTYSSTPGVYLSTVSGIPRGPISTPAVLNQGASGAPNLGPSTARYLGGSDKFVGVPVEEYGYSTSGYTGQEPSYFTREYLLESPVTKTYDDEYQYLSPVTTPQTTRQPVTRKTIQRKISTTLPPTLPPATTPKPRRVPSRKYEKPFEKIQKDVPNRTYRPIDNYDYYDDGAERIAEKYEEGTKVVVHGKGTIECLDIGNFPHPSSCKKFISCARIDNGSLLGWEYICPKGLSFDPVGGICNWSAGLGCDEKDL